MPFVIFGVVFLHVAALHVTGSNNPLGIEPKGPQDTLPFHPYYTAKDSIGVVAYFMVFAFLVFFVPNYLGHTDNYIPANPLVTPAHIVPEWYFLPFYAILRAVPDKLGGVALMIGSILVWFVLPWLDTSKVRSMRFRPVARIFFLLWVASFFVLMWCGAKPAEQPYVLISQLATAYYFLWFLVLLPVLGRLERPLPLPESIAAAVLGPREVLGAGPLPGTVSAKPMDKA
jgi:ubiquinol-cytochrome c reductase cytochrome b subunit